MIHELKAINISYKHDYNVNDKIYEYKEMYGTPIFTAVKNSSLTVLYYLFPYFSILRQ
jgi:hypothetical protein